MSGKESIVLPRGYVPYIPYGLNGDDNRIVGLIKETVDNSNLDVTHSHEKADGCTKGKETFAVKGEQYHVVRSLGRGSSGEAFLVVDQREKQFVVKKIDKTRFKEDELEVMKLLGRNPYTIYLHDSEITDQHVLLLMEYANGGNLKDYLEELRASNKLFERDKFKIFEDLMHAVDHIRSKSIVHADIKPENILVFKSQNGKYERLVLADFGLSFCTAAPPTEVRGTPRYRSPELDNGKSLNTVESDIWACGCVLVYIFTGRMIWNSIAWRKILGLTKSKIASNLPKLFWTLCDATLALKPDKRSTAEDICSMVCLSSFLDLVHKASESNKSDLILCHIGLPFLR